MTCIPCRGPFINSLEHTELSGIPVKKYLHTLVTQNVGEIKIKYEYMITLPSIILFIFLTFMDL
jgi:hypothetical protein